MKGFLSKMCFLLMAIALSVCHPPPAVAQSVKFDDFRIVKKSLTVGKVTSLKAPANIWLQVADTGSNRASIQLQGTDTSKVAKPLLPGAIIYSRADSTLRICTGTRWKKVTLTN